MSNVRFDFSGLGKVQHNIGDFLERKASAIGQELEQSAKAAAPVKTGALRASITFEVARDGDRVVIRVGSPLPYARKIELGSHNTAAKSYLREPLITNFSRIGALLKS